MITVTPTLSSTSGYLEDVRDQIANLLRFMIMNPGRTSSLWEEDLISFRKLAAEYQGDRSTLIDQTRFKLTNSFKRMFPDYNIEVSLSTADYDPKIGDDGRYTLSISITIEGLDPDHPEISTAALITGNISVDPETNAIDLRFETGQDTALLTTS